jgi:ethanolaminephosphotransferase
MLDEMDGKQARRTQNSSPLGLIFDHGCDAFAMGLQTIIFLIVAQIGNNKLSYITIIVNMSAFHFSTLEEYYLGILELPPLNGVSDGSIIIILYFIACGIVGNEKMALNVRPGEWLHIDGIK